MTPYRIDFPQFGIKGMVVEQKIIGQKLAKITDENHAPEYSDVYEITIQTDDGQIVKRKYQP